MSAGGEFFAWLGQAAVVGFGWWVIHRLSAARDRDKARREMVADSADHIAYQLNDIHSDARAYHLTDRNATIEVRLKMSLQDAAMHAAGLSDICKDDAILARCRAEISALRRAITGEHFEDEQLGPLPETAEQFQRIADAFLRAKRGLLQLKHLQFPAV
ncbi:hypothetical protein [Variovorax saccharolyticus]|uniref:hypothetical protein n=1 Tax=Variovorax saccharolyticus TaxID=3053516 RepID=UPI002577C121|nr:hypothetical protein [Variovorax sp. J22R187]MDM0018365.1 hypothetical protein [Variovorax sp. J22R187]